MTRLTLDANLPPRSGMLLQPVELCTIDEELQDNPYAQGESREGDERVFFVYP